MIGFFHLVCFRIHLYCLSIHPLFFKYISLIMLLQLPHFCLPLIPLCPAFPYLQHPPQLSSCQWVIHVSSLASPFPKLFLTSSCLFCTYYLCCLFPVPFPPFSSHPSPLITFHVISISVILFLDADPGPRDLCVMAIMDKFTWTIEIL